MMGMCMFHTTPRWRKLYIMAQPPEFGRTRGPLPEVHDEALQGTRPWPRLDYHVLYSYDSGHTRSEHEDGRPQQIPKSCSKWRETNGSRASWVRPRTPKASRKSCVGDTTLLTTCKFIISACFRLLDGGQGRFRRGCLGLGVLSTKGHGVSIIPCLHTWHR